jgi:nucleoside 2-deoxyribosyltransferase
VYNSLIYKPRIYCAGPMAGLTFEEANAWREEARLNLTDAFELVSPCRNKESLSGHGPLTKLGYDDHFMCAEQTVFYRDTHDVCTCDGVLVNFSGVSTVSIGTNFELGMAWALKLPIVSIMPENSVYDHIFIRQSSTFMTDDPMEAYNALRSLFNRL